MIKFVTERPEYSDIIVSANSYCYTDYESTEVLIQQDGSTISIPTESVDNFIEALVLARTAAETKFAEQKAELAAV